MMKRLENKVAVVYGDGGVRTVIAKAFAREGANVFLTGRTLKKFGAIAEDITACGGTVETAILDAMDEQAVEEHMRETVKHTGEVDISFNAIGIPQKGIQGIPLTELSVENFSLPIKTYTQSRFVTAKAAARRMVKRRHGVIILHTPNASRISAPFVGGMIPSLGGNGSTLSLAVAAMCAVWSAGSLSAHDRHTRDATY
jgi:NADP-dependent 3-hydroxy acid dehydrogenase YdfG